MSYDTPIIFLILSRLDDVLSLITKIAFWLIAPDKPPHILNPVRNWHIRQSCQNFIPIPPRHFAGNTGFKVAQNIFNKILHNRMVNH